MKKIIVRVILILVLLGIIGLYAYDAYRSGTLLTENLLKAIAASCTCIAALIRNFAKKRVALSVYEKRYEDAVRSAFTNRPNLRKKLLCAVRLYDENKLNKALKYLADLKKQARTPDEHYATNLFAALSFTDLRLYEQAERIYIQLIQSRLADSRIFSNLGHVQMKTGEYQKALRNYEYALEYDRDNTYALNNIAQAHFQMHEFDETIVYAQKALDINPKMYQASSLLAIVYSLQGNAELTEKYFHIAISSGRDPAELKQATAYYRTAQQAVDEASTVEE